MSHACHRFWKCYETLTSWSFLAGCRIPCACHTKPHPNFKKCTENGVCFVHVDFEMCFAPQLRALFRHLNLPKRSEPEVFFDILTSTCASRHNGAHFFDISTSKSALNVRFFLAFWLRNDLRATMPCNFSSLIRPVGSAPLLWLFPSVLSHLPILLSEVWLLNFLR